jgi:proline iminopeptidase
VEGKGAQSIIVLHGGAGLSMAYLRPDLEPLGTYATVIYYDQRGRGRSSLTANPKHLTVAKHVDDLESVRKFFGLQRITLLGHSWGAGLAIEYALRYPRRVDRLIMVAAMEPRRAAYDDQFQANVVRWMDEKTRAELAALSDSMSNAPDIIGTCRRFFALLIRGYYADPARITWSRGDPCADPPEAIRAGNQTNTLVNESWGNWDYRERVKNLRTQSLLIHGVSDPIPLEAAKEWVATLPVSRLLVVPNSGHFPFVEQPEQFFSAVGAFINGTWPPGSAKKSK